jgi:hypothetical protein
MKKTDKQKKISLIQDYIAVFSSDEGQNVLKDLMEKGSLLKPTYADNDRLSLLNEGRRELLLYVLHNLSYDVSSILELMDESQNEKREKKNYEDEDFDFFKD